MKLHHEMKITRITNRAHCHTEEQWPGIEKLGHAMTLI
jgi:hypothetical protein